MKRLAPLLIALCTLAACHTTSDKPPCNKPSLGEYLYLDKENTLHTNLDCPNIKPLISYRQETKDITYGYFYDRLHCPHCITDEIYDSLLTIAESNKTDVDTYIEEVDLVEAAVNEASPY